MSEGLMKSFNAQLRNRFPEASHLSELMASMDMAAQLAQRHPISKQFVLEDAGIRVQIDGEVATFGFVHWPGEMEVVAQLWDRVVAWSKAQGAVRLCGPIQGSTFFPYRFVVESDGSDFFPGEFPSLIADHECMMSLNPDKVHYYRSGYRDRFDRIMKVSEPYFDKAKLEGLKITTHGHVSDELFEQVLPLVPVIFGENWGFSALDASAVVKLLEVGEPANDGMKLQCIWLDETLIGFCRYVEHNDHTLVCKTLGLMPAYQKRGFGNAVVYEMHRAATNAGYTRMIYALIYDHNRVQQNMPKDDSIIFRRYASYEFNIMNP